MKQKRILRIVLVVVGVLLLLNLIRLGPWTSTPAYGQRTVQYQVYANGDADPKKIAALLNDAGKQGWELAAITGTTLNVILVLKK